MFNPFRQRKIAKELARFVAQLIPLVDDLRKKIDVLEQELMFAGTQAGHDGGINPDLSDKDAARCPHCQSGGDANILMVQGSHKQIYCPVCNLTTDGVKVDFARPLIADIGGMTEEQRDAFGGTDVLKEAGYRSSDEQERCLKPYERPMETPLDEATALLVKKVNSPQFIEWLKEN